METTVAPALAPAPAKQKRRISLVLPYDVVVDIVGLVATTSQHPFADLGSMAATCKAMYTATKEPEVLRRMALQNENMMKWCKNNRYLVLIDDLARVGNPEACFLSGIMSFYRMFGKVAGAS